MTKKKFDSTTFLKEEKSTSNSKQFFLEELHGTNYQQKFKVDQMIYEGSSEFQKIDILENRYFKRILALDNIIQTTEGDEFIYHEMMTHIPIFAHGNVKKVLIIGGGDGGILREVLRHKGIEKATIVEIDGKVIELCKEYMPSLSDGAFEDPRADVIVGDGIDFVKTTTEKFDVIICDSTDPVGPGMVLFTKDFYSACKKILNQDGILVTQNGVPFFQKNELVETYQNRKAIFKDNRFYLAVIPTYIGGFMAMGWATDNESYFNISQKDLETRLISSNIKMKYYTPKMHLASFTLPKFIEDMLQ